MDSGAESESHHRTGRILTIGSNYSAIKQDMFTNQHTCCLSKMKQILIYFLLFLLFVIYYFFLGAWRCGERGKWRIIFLSGNYT